MNDKAKLLTALIEKPSRYTIDVVENDMLPEKMRDKKSLDFVIKPPTLETLSHCAIHLQGLPKEVLEAKELAITDALNHIDVMVKVICIISSTKADYPDWYESFFKKNCTPKEIFGIFHETSLKMQTDFFLTSFQIASQINPMMMKMPEKIPNASTPFS